jgi:hypothetical protein
MDQQARDHCRALGNRMIRECLATAQCHRVPVAMVSNAMLAHIVAGLADMLGRERTADLLTEVASVIRSN